LELLLLQAYTLEFRSKPLELRIKTWSFKRTKKLNYVGSEALPTSVKERKTLRA
jgi:hypothetical protein